VPASAYSLFLICGDRVKVVVGEWVMVVRRCDAPLTWGEKRGECALEEVRLEAWYGWRACEWNVDGDAGAEMVGEEVSIAGIYRRERLRSLYSVVPAALAIAPSQLFLDMVEQKRAWRGRARDPRGCRGSTSHDRVWPL
jgi:hypothetical protein